MKTFVSPGNMLMLAAGFQSLECINTDVTSKESILATCIVGNLLPIYAIVVVIITWWVGKATHTRKRQEIWSPKLVNGASFLLTCFETFFVFIVSSAVNIGFARYAHPPREDGSQVTFFSSSHYFFLLFS